MNAQNALATLRRHEGDLRARSIRHAAVFRVPLRRAVTYRPDSDLDTTIDIGPDPASEYVGRKEYFGSL
jgi:hypothetical protein